GALVAYVIFSWFRPQVKGDVIHLTHRTPPLGQLANRANTIKRTKEGSILPNDCWCCCSINRHSRFHLGALGTLHKYYPLKSSPPTAYAPHQPTSSSSLARQAPPSKPPQAPKHRLAGRAYPSGPIRSASSVPRKLPRPPGTPRSSPRE